MKKSTRNVLIVLIIILFILCLISFNVNGIKRLFNKSNMKYMYTAEEVEEDAVYDYAVAETRAAMSNKQMAQTFAGSMAINTAEAPMVVENGAGDIERKLIKNIYLDCETQDFDGTYDLVKRKVLQYDGIVDSENFNNGKYRNTTKRNCYFDIRVPKDSVDSFVSDISKNVNVLNKSESTQDVTDNYYDTVARLKNYKLEEEKLQELMKKATRVEDLVTIEEKLQNVRVEIENIERRIKNLDKQIDYSTVNLSLSEVVVYTRPEDVKPTKEGLITAFKKNFEDTKNFIINTGYYIFTHIPAICLVLCGGLLLLIVMIIIVTVVDGNGKKKITKIDDEYSIKEEIKQEVKKEIKKEEKKEDKKAKVDAKKDSKNYVKLSSALENSYIDLDKPLEKKEETKKDDDGFTMADLDFTSTK